MEEVELASFWNIFFGGELWGKGSIKTFHGNAQFDILEGTIFTKDTKPEESD
jgi:hypothetical protein